MRRSMLQRPGRKEGKGLTGTIAAAAIFSAGALMPPAALSEEPVYSVVSPIGEQTAEMIEMAPRLDTLANQTVCMVSNSSFKVNVTMPVIASTLQESYPGLKVVPYNELPTAYSGARWDAMPATFKSRGCDAVISGNGG